jgi:N-acetylglucosamine kinase-like BadF-type ATPase
MRYVVGMDGGGTKTAVIVADEKGQVVWTFTSGGMNVNGQDEAGIRQSFRHIFEEVARVCGGLDACQQVCIGAAGISNPAAAGRLVNEVRECGYLGGLILVGDHETAHYGALERPVGMILIAGTGSICYGRNKDGLSHRTGGFGHLVDDEGSGYSIGRDLISAVLRASDGRLPPTSVTGMVLEKLQLASVQQIIGFVYDPSTHKKDIAALAPLLSDACKQGDEAAMAIVQRSASSLLELTVPVVEKLSLQEEQLAMAGSVLLHNTFVQSAFMERLGRRFPELHCFPAKKDASAGAVLMALNRLN